MNKITDNLADQTLVSVCMATYNGGKYIREQVDSILNQELGCPVCRSKNALD